MVLINIWDKLEQVKQRFPVSDSACKELGNHLYILKQVRTKQTEKSTILLVYVREVRTEGKLLTTRLERNTDKYGEVWLTWPEIQERKSSWKQVQG